MRKRNILLILLAAAIVIIAVVAWGVRQPQTDQPSTVSFQSGDQQADIIFYFGQECPHCKVVEKFIADNKIEQKVIFSKKEVWHNAANNDELQEKVKECALDPSNVGVPFLYARGKCYVGEIEVEDFFKKEAGLQ